MTENDESTDKIREGGKKIAKGITKGGILFSKRIAEGVVNATIAQKHEEETIDKVVAAGSEIGKAAVKGTIESAKESVPDIISGVSAIASGLQDRVKKKD